MPPYQEGVGVIVLVEWRPLSLRQPLYHVIVRAGKDRDAVQAMINKFYAGWPIRVSSLQGIRDPGEIAERVRSYALSNDGLVLYISGRLDREAVQLIEDSGVVNIAAVSLEKRQVRNARLEEIAWAFERARARLRLRLSLLGDAIEVHSAKQPRLQGLVDDQPYADVFIATSGWIRWLKRLGAEHVDESSLVILERLSGGMHYVFVGGELRYELHIPDAGRPIVRIVRHGAPAGDAKKLYASNSIEFHERLSLRLIREALEAAEEKLGSIDAIVVPWSGGKDSTVTLHIARTVVKNVIAVYVDTGVDFPHTREYIDEMAARLGVEVIKVYAPVRDLIPEKGMPRHDYRWCTGEKLEALRRALARLGEKIVIVTGDRDAESEPRSHRPPFRLEVIEQGNKRIEAVVVTPLKQWSTLLLQAYADARGLRLNMLYELGFYRLGCYICPALRSWEKMLIAREPLVASRLVGLPYYSRVARLRQG